MSDAVESHLPGTHGNVLETGHQHVTLGVQGIGRIICHQLECLQLLHQSYNKKKRSSGEDQENRVIKYRVILKNLPATLASDATSCAQTTMVSSSAAARVA